MAKQVNVAAAVLLREDGRVLLGQRAPETFYPGYWEFPGGKVEAGESARDALLRELHEELGIRVTRATPWITRRHAYEHAHVTLHFFTVSAWQGELNDHVHAALSWQDPHDFAVAPMLPANGPILKSLRLPRVMAVTRAGSVGVERQLREIEAALARGLRLIQVREPQLPADTLSGFCRQVVARAREHGALVLINDDADLAQRCAADGVQLKAASLAALKERPPLAWVGASCHTREELQRAEALEVDYVVVGAVRTTPTHPAGSALGWTAFAELVRGLPMPCFAIGGLGGDDLEAAQELGAHGVAMIRGAWASAV